MARIAFLQPDFGGGGAERVALDLAAEFRRQGHDVSFVVMQAQGELLEEARRNHVLHDLGTVRARGLLPALVRYLRRQRPDVLMVAMWPLTAIAPLACRLSGTGCRSLISEHAVLSMQYQGRGWVHDQVMRRSISLGYRLADVRVGVSRGTCDDMALLSGLPRERMVHIPNPIRRLGARSQDVERATGAWKTQGPRILTVGNLRPVKNHHLLLRAFARLRHVQASLLILGAGECRDALGRTAAELGIAERVTFAGFQSDPAPYFGAADLFVLSSDHEGFGNVLVEALSFGLPVVSTDCPSGPREILEDGRWGRLVPPGDADALARAIDEGLDAPRRSEDLRRRAADFAPEVAARRYLEVLRLPVSAAGGAPGAMQPGPAAAER